MSKTAHVARQRMTADAATLRQSTTAFIEPSSGDRVEIAGVDYLSIFTPDLRRSAAFYARVFGFRVIEASRDRGGRSVRMRSGRFRFAIHERPWNVSHPLPALRWSFVVDDLDRARASVWNLGVVPFRDGTHGPQGDGAENRNRLFVIRDPGGNEIEIVER